MEAVVGEGYNNAQIIMYRQYLNLTAIDRKLSTLIIVAIASFNSLVTGIKHAIFGTLLADRE